MLRSQKALPPKVANYGHLFNASRSDNIKSEFGNNRDYSKDLEDGEQECSIHRQQKKLRSLAKRKRLQFEEETYIQPRKEYLWNSEHIDDKDIAPLKGRENLNHHKGKEEAYLHRNREEMQSKKVKEGFDKHKERGDNIRRIGDSILKKRNENRIALARKEATMSRWERATFISHGNIARHANYHGNLKPAQICGTIAGDEKR
eukprot:Gb_01806 [translate_table: standard]